MGCICGTPYRTPSDTSTPGWTWDLGGFDVDSIKHHHVPLDTGPATHSRILLHVAELTPPKITQPVPILCLHGWPLVGYSWSRQMASLGSTGSRVLVPDLRGFGESSCPQAEEAYTQSAVLSDIVALLDIWKPTKPPMTTRYCDQTTTMRCICRISCRTTACSWHASCWSEHIRYSSDGQHNVYPRQVGRDQYWKR